MFLTADEVARGLKSSVAFISVHPRRAPSFDTSFEGFWRSFAAVLLTAPALLVALAAIRFGHAGTATDPLLDPLALAAGMAPIAALFVAFPAVMIAVVRLAGLERRYVPFVVAHNWSNVIVVTLLAVPTALLVMRFATPSLAILYTAAFGAIVIKLRFTLARAMLGVSAGMAAIVTALDLGMEFAVVAVLGAVI